MENGNMIQPEVLAAPPLALSDVLIGAENCRTMVENGNRRRSRFYLQNRITV